MPLSVHQTVAESTRGPRKGLLLAVVRSRLRAVGGGGEVGKEGAVQAESSPLGVLQDSGKEQWAATRALVCPESRGGLRPVAG